MYVYSKKLEKNIWISKNKVHLQDWLKKVKFSHTITIEPTPSFPFKLDEIQQRLRQIDFKLNRYYLGNNFQKFDDSKRIWMICFKEIQNNPHYNILLHSPFDDDTNEDICNRFILEWALLPSFNPYTQKYRDSSIVPINISTTKNVNMSVNYQTKKFNFDDLVDSDNWFFSNPKSKYKEVYMNTKYDCIMNAVEKLNSCRT